MKKESYCQFLIKEYSKKSKREGTDIDSQHNYALVLFLKNIANSNDIKRTVEAWLFGKINASEEEYVERTLYFKEFFEIVYNAGVTDLSFFANLFKKFYNCLETSGFESAIKWYKTEYASNSDWLWLSQKEEDARTVVLDKALFITAPKELSDQYRLVNMFQ